MTRSLSRPAVPAPSVVVGDAGRDAVSALRVSVAGAAVIADDDDPVRHATAWCHACAWVAIMRGDTDEEITDFLRQQYAVHVAERHPEALTDD